jgi:molybdopterin-guanine dinucleotide biosynthesis protein B
MITDPNALLRLSHHGGTATPVLGFAAFSGTGKTTLLRELIPRLRTRGLRLGLVKHSHHAFEIDRPGKDSFLLRQAGASQVVLASRRRTVVQRRYRTGGGNAAIEAEPDLADFLRCVDRPTLDLLLVEGYKHAPIPKIELHRPALGHPLLAERDAAVIAVASDEPPAAVLAVPLLNINAVDEVAAFVLDTYLPALAAAGAAR